MGYAVIQDTLIDAEQPGTMNAGQSRGGGHLLLPDHHIPAQTAPAADF
jgi:hypothetical protein